MIISLEGPDRSGKSTLLEPLANALRTPHIIRKWVTAEVQPHLPLAETIYLQLFAEMYSPRLTYVCDRSPTVSAQVYSRVFERQCRIDPKPWYAREVIVYVNTPIEELQRRHALTGDDCFPAALYQRVIDTYSRVLVDYTTICVDGRWPVEQSIHSIITSLEGLRKVGKVVRLP